MKTLYAFLVLLLIFPLNLLADLVPIIHRDHCREWKNNKCVSGALTDLAQDLSADSESPGGNRSALCDSICQTCEVQCKDPQGVCGAKGYCHGGKPQTDRLTYCVEHTTNDICMPCK